MRSEASCPTRELRKLGNLDLVWLRDQARENAIRVGGRGAAPSPEATRVAEKVLTLRLERYVDRELALPQVGHRLASRRTGSVSRSRVRTCQAYRTPAHQ